MTYQGDTSGRPSEFHPSLSVKVIVVWMSGKRDDTTEGITERRQTPKDVTQLRRR